MSDKKQTAVEWLKHCLPSLFVDDSGHYEGLFNQAREMEREQIVDAYCAGSPEFKDMAEEFYHETYGGNNG